MLAEDVERTRNICDYCLVRGWVGEDAIRHPSSQREWRAARACFLPLHTSQTRWCVSKMSWVPALAVSHRERLQITLLSCSPNYPDERKRQQQG